MQSDRLHVLVVTRAIAPVHGVGGLERHGRDLVNQLLARGLFVTLVTQPPGAVQAGETWQHERLDTHFVPYLTFPGAGRRGTTVLDRSTAYPLFGWRAGWLAAKLVSRGSIDIVHGMGAATLGYAAAREADRVETVPLLFNPHGMEEFGSTGPGLSAGKGLAYAPLRKAVRRCARAADRVVATDAVLVPTVKAHLSVPESRIAVVPNAVDLEALDRSAAGADLQAMRQRAGVPPGGVLMMSAGRLEENKGFHVLVAALSRVAGRLSGNAGAAPSWRLVLAGDGSERNRLERDIGAAGLRDLVMLAGRVDDAELHGWYEAADLFVHPSLYEGSSIVTLEAMAHRCPVVATTAGGLRDKVRQGVNGWLVAPGDPEALAASIRDALGNPERLPAMGEESRAIVERDFSWQAVTDTLLALYAEMRRGGAPRG